MSGFPAVVLIDDKCDACEARQVRGVSWGYRRPVLCLECLARGWAEMARHPAGARAAPLSAQPAPRLIIVTRVLGDGDGDGNDLLLGPSAWRAIDHGDGTHTIVVSPELEARARELWPGVPVEKGDAG